MIKRVSKNIIVLITTIVTSMILTAYADSENDQNEVIINNSKVFSKQELRIINLESNYYIPLNSIKKILPFEVEKEGNNININTSVSDFEISNFGYNNFENKSMFLSITENFIESKYFPKNAIVVVGNPNCSSCIAFLPKFDSKTFALKGNLFYEDIFYLSSESLSKEFIKKYELKYLPTVITFKDNKFYKKFDKFDDDLSNLMKECKK